ncbi:MAG TPA: TSUP family transporter [Bacteroidota bacterium]|nr:TSUP family transporter [Bacteroidota bacterium]
MLESFWLYPLLFCTGAAAGLIDSIAGGGGLITLPVALAIGMPPKVALGTNKFQSSFGSFTATFYYVKHKIVSLREAKLGIFFTLVGAVAGAWGVEQVDSSVLNRVIPFLLLAIVVYTFVTPRFGETSGRARMSASAFFAGAGLALGFYDGFFGPGVGSFWAMALVFGLGMDLTRATGATKLMNFTSNIVSCIIFLAGGFVWLGAGLAMAAGEIVGARFGSHMVIRKGTAIIRPIYISIVILTIAKLLYNTYSR